MPELPEVQTITSDLKETIVGFKIAKSFVSPSYYKIKDGNDFASKLQGKAVIDVTRIAKNILIKLDSGEYIHIHLAMTGQVFILEPSQIKGKKAHVIFHLKNKAKENKIMTFSDVRTFGKIEILDSQGLKLLQEKYGVEPIAQSLDVNKLYESLKKKKTIVKNILMDQSLVAGLGNIYATEALFLSGIHPKAKMNQISFAQFEKLMQMAKFILEQGITNRGSTLPDKMYVDVWGKQGQQQNFFNVYLKEICKNCKSNVVYEKIAGRGTYYCSNCQPLPTS